MLKGQVTGPMLCRRDRDGLSLAAPFRPDAPAPLSALLCLARVERWNGRPHLVWSFDQEGRPKIPCGPA